MKRFLILGLILFGFILSGCDGSYKKIGDLKQLGYDKELGGSFFLGCGGIGETAKYYFIYKDNQGYYIPDYNMIIYCVIEESSKEVPAYYESDGFTRRPYLFVIPPNSIKQFYNPNLKREE